MIVVFLVVCSLMTPFAIIATHLFGGRLHRCKVLSPDSKASFVIAVRVSLTDRLLSHQSLIVCRVWRVWMSQSRQRIG
jgi:hypothetical protein